MKRFIFAVAVGAFALGVALGPAAPQGAPAPGTCESKAVSKAGKQLAGAAKNSFMAKCKREACAPKAVGSDGKPLKGCREEQFHGEMPARASLITRVRHTRSRMCSPSMLLTRVDAVIDPVRCH